MYSSKGNKNLKGTMRFTILMCLVWCTLQSSCLSHLQGEDCEQIQEAGQRLSENIKSFDKLLQDLIMRCFEESQLITESSIKFMLTQKSSVAMKKSIVPTDMDSDSRIQQIYQLMTPKLDASFNTGYAEFFALLKKAGKMVVADSVVTDALISYPNTGRKKRSLYNIDDKIKSLRQVMNTSLSGVETSLHGVASQLFTMFTNSLKTLSSDQQFKTNVDNVQKDMSKYLLQAMHVFVDSNIDQFYLILKHSAQQIEIIDSHLTASTKSKPKRLALAVKPAKLFVDEAIRDLRKMVGSTEMKRQLRMKLDWMKTEFKTIKTKMTQV